VRAALAVATSSGLACGSAPGPPPAPATSLGGKADPSRSAELPTISLDRLAGPRGQSGAGRRDIFAGQAPVVPVAPTPAPTPPPPAGAAATEPGTPSAGPAAGSAAAPRSALAGLRCIGLVERRGGLRAAVFTTDRGEVLAGRVGEVVGGRVKVVAIGLESVDVQEVGTDRTMRLPLRGN
jgi:hypothetical protein